MQRASAFQGSEKAKREKGAEEIRENEIAENLLNLGKDTDIQVQETKGVSNMMNPKRNTSRHAVIKMAKRKDKKRILKAARKIHKLHTRELS